MANTSPRPSIHLLGPPEVLIAGTPLALSHLKAQALLFFLAANPQAYSRDSLGTLLWSEAGSRDIHHALRTSVYRLRQALRVCQAEDVLLSEGDLLSLRPGGFDCDLLAFRGALAEGSRPALARAVELYRGPLLQGFSVEDAPGFEEWLRDEDARLSQACFGALENLAGEAQARGSWPAVAGFARRMVQLDPLAEKAQQLLILAHVRQGEPGLALRQYRQFEEQLRSELGLSPSAETRALLSTPSHPPRGLPPRALSPTHAQVQPLPFIGREPLLRQLQSISQQAAAGQGATVLLEGEGGIGKSRLIDEWTARLLGAEPHWLVLQGACTPFDDLLSHGPFLEALQNAAPDSPANLLNEPGSGEPGARDRFAWSVVQAIRALAESGPLLLVIEDLHWASSPTLNLFGLLSMRLRHLPVMLVGTVQHSESIPALQRLIALGRRRGELHLLALTPLSVDSVAALLQASGIRLDGLEPLAVWLHARSAGSPFLLSEILSQLRSEGILQPDSAGGWQADIPRWLRWRAAFTLPETTHDLVAWRLESLSPSARYLLDVLAAAGQPLPEAALRGFPGILDEQLLPLMDELAARGLVIEPPGGLLALSHHLLRETLLHRLSHLRRRAIDQNLAQALEAHPAADPLAARRQIARYAVAGEDVDRARRYGLDLLEDLPEGSSGPEMLDFTSRLYDLLAPGASASEMMRLARALGALHESLGHLDSAAHWHAQYLNWAQKTGDFAAQAAAYFAMGELALMRNDYQAASRAAAAGLDLVKAVQPGAVPLSARGHRLLGAAYAMEGSDLAAAQAQLEQAVAAHRLAGNQLDACAGLFELGNIAAQRGELPRALDFYQEAARAAQAGAIHYYLALAHNNFAYHSLLLGKVGAAQEAVAAGMKVAETYDLLAALLHLYSTQGEIQLYLAEWKAAQESFQRGLALAEDLGSLERQAGYRGGLALAARGQGDPAQAARLLREALSLIAEQGYWHLRTRLQLWLAETLFEQNDPAQAAAELEVAIATARAQQRTLLCVQGECLRARLLAAGGDWPSAQALFRETLSSAQGLGLPLEVARVQSAWGQCELRYASESAAGQALLAAARATFSAHAARADLALLMTLSK
jgi:DNA-binding SARP family transcriptional activator/tetratricopeptide (TPR) repeat protein